MSTDNVDTITMYRDDRYHALQSIIGIQALLKRMKWITEETGAAELEELICATEQLALRAEDCLGNLRDRQAATASNETRIRIVK